MHLGLDAVQATLATVVGCPPGIWIVLTYNQLQAVLQGPEAQVGAVLARLVGELGEPFVSLCSPLPRLRT